MSPVDRLPLTPDDITAQWLTQAMTQRGHQVQVNSVQVTGQTKGTNASALLSVVYAHPTQLPNELFVKMLPADPRQREAITLTGMGPKEVLFYQQLAQRVSMRTPMVLAAELDENDGSFVVVLEDLLANGCQLPDPQAGLTPEQAMGAMVDYAHLHHRYLDAEIRASEAGWVSPSRRGSDYGKIRLQAALDNHRDRIGAPFAELAEFYIAHQDQQHDLWAQGERSVLQGDSHLGNVFLDGDRVGFLDWGLINLGACMRDVSYFITMTLSPENRRANETALIGEYLDQRSRLGPVPMNFAQAWEEHRLQASYTVVASCQIVTFPSSWTPEREREALAFLGRSQAAVADLESRAAIREVTGI